MTFFQQLLKHTHSGWFLHPKIIGDGLFTMLWAFDMNMSSIDSMPLSSAIPKSYAN